MKVKALTGFSHGGFSPLEGEEIEVPDVIGKELQKAGLVAGGSAEDSPEARAKRSEEARKQLTEDAAKIEAKRQEDELRETTERARLLDERREMQGKIATPMHNRMIRPEATKVIPEKHTEAPAQDDGDDKKTGGAAAKTTTTPAKK